MHKFANIHVYELKDCKKKIKNYALGLRIRILSNRNDAVVQPAVEDPVDDDRIPVEAGADMIPAPCEPSEFEKMKHRASKAKHMMNHTNKL